MKSAFKWEVSVSGNQYLINKNQKIFITFHVCCLLWVIYSENFCPILKYSLSQIYFFFLAYISLNCLKNKIKYLIAESKCSIISVDTVTIQRCNKGGADGASAPGAKLISTPFSSQIFTINVLLNDKRNKQIFSLQVPNRIAVLL